jgi:hypothetical protein
VWMERAEEGRIKSFWSNESSKILPVVLLYHIFLSGAPQINNYDNGVPYVTGTCTVRRYACATVYR